MINATFTRQWVFYQNVVTVRKMTVVQCTVPVPQNGAARKENVKLKIERIIQHNKDPCAILTMANKY